MKNPFLGFLAILYKEFTICFRDKTTLFFMFFPPLVQIIAPMCSWVVTLPTGATVTYGR